MNKLNKLGMSAIEYRKEFFNSAYPELVHSSIEFVIDKKFEGQSVILAELKDSTIDDFDFKQFLLTQESCCKTYEELLVEFEQLRKNLELDSIDVETESDIQHDCILVQKEFLLSENFLRNYFWIDSEMEFEKLMKKQGFVEKFAILRLKKILHDFINSLDSQIVQTFNVSHTPVFFNSERNIYGINLELKIDIGMIETPDELLAIRESVMSLLDAARSNYSEKMKN